VLPASSLAYVVVALLSRFWLHEQITPARWLGIFCIVAGVGFVTRGPAYTEHPAVEAAVLPDPAAPLPIGDTIAQPQAKATIPNGAKAMIPNGAKQ
jgi:drug/metabolite transporter (DMT)-like permease